MGVSPTRRGSRAAFTLVEVVVASVVCALVAGAAATAVSQISRIRDRSLARRQAIARADAGAARIALDALACVRHHDLRFAKVQVIDGGIAGDQLLLLTRSLRRVRSPDASTEGGVYEAQYRVDALASEVRPALWRRVDHAFDPALDAGGVAEPVVRGVRSLQIQASDGETWFDAWDSDADGLPHGLRVIVEGVSDDGSATAIARRVISIDQVPVPPETEPSEDDAGTPAPTGGAANTQPSGAAGGATQGGGRP